MKRLNAIIMNNNYISRIGQIGGNLPELKTLILTNNKVSNLSEVNNLMSIKKIEILSLLDNPVVLRPNYRLYVIYQLPNLRLLDYLKVQKKERDEASKFFKTPSGKTFLASITEEGIIIIIIKNKINFKL